MVPQLSNRWRWTILKFIQAFVSHCSASISLAIKNLRDHSTRRSSPNILLRSSGLLYVHKRAQQAPSYQLIRKHSPGSPFRYEPVVAVFKPNFGFQDLPFFAVSVMEFLHCIHSKFAHQISNCKLTSPMHQVSGHSTKCHTKLFAWASK